MAASPNRIRARGQGDPGRDRSARRARGATWFLALAAPLVPLLSSGAAAAPPPSCPASHPEVALAVEVPEPVIDNSLSQLQLQKISKAQRGAHTLGLYQAELQARTDAVVGSRRNAEAVCHWLDKVTVTVFMAQRRIYVIRERKPGTCFYDSVLAHERQHQAIDDAVLAAELPRLRQEVAEGIARLPTRGAVPQGESAVSEARLGAELKAVLRRSLQRLVATRNARQAALDTPGEYRRIRAACERPPDDRMPG
jgi:hypothetical protein